MALIFNGTTGISGVDGSASAPALTGTDSNTGINFGSDTVNINTGGVTRASLSSVGKFSIEHATSGNVAAEIHTSGSGLGNQLHLHNDHGLAYVGQAGDTTGDFIVYNGSNSNMLFSTNASERMRIDSNGIMNLRGNGSTFSDQTAHHCIQNNKSTSWAFQAVNTASYGYGVEIRVNSDTASREALYVYSTAATQSKATILSSGSFQSRTNSYGALSDIKLKENIIDASSQWNDIKAVKIRNFNFISDSSNTKLLGVVAQELETVCPNLIETCTDKEIDENGDRVETGTTTKSVKYSVLYMKAIKALQEAQARIETLETKVAALEAA